MANGVGIDLAQKLATFDDHWSPRIVETLDDYDVKVVKAKGEFVWHAHPAEDELFLVLKGRIRIDFRDRRVELGPGEMIVVPKGTEHKPFAEEECELLLLERRGVVNTGDAEPQALTRTRLERI